LTRIRQVVYLEGIMHINRNRQALGQFSDEEVAEGLQSGKFLPTDLAWREGMDSWQPLSEFTDLPEVPGVEAAADAGPAPVVVVLPAWEKPDPGASLPLAVESAKEILGAPVPTFQAMPTGGGMGRPLKFYLLVSWVTTAVAVIYQMVAASINPAMFAREAGAEVSQTMMLSVMGGAILLMPIFLLAGVFISAGVLHGALHLLGGAKKPFEATLRVLCYAGGATSAIQLIPLCGGYLSSIAWMVYSVIGLKEAHGTDLWRPIAALALVALMCCGAIIGVAVFISALAGALSAAGK